MEPFRAFIKTMLGSLRDLAPIVGVIGFFQLVVLQQPTPNLGEILLGTFLVVIGLALFLRSLELGLFPIGESMAYAFVLEGMPAQFESA